MLGGLSVGGRQYMGMGAALSLEVGTIVGNLIGC